MTTPFEIKRRLDALLKRHTEDARATMSADDAGFVIARCQEEYRNALMEAVALIVENERLTKILEEMKS